MHLVRRDVLVVLVRHAGGALLVGVGHLGRPPFAQVAVAVVLPAAVVESVGQLVTHHQSRAAEIRRVRRLGREERRLQDARREHHLVLGGVVVGVDRRGRHAPFVAVDRLADHVQIALGGVARRFLHVGEQRGAVDLHRVVLAPAVGIAHLVVQLVQLLGGDLAGRVVHPGDAGEVLVERLLDPLDHLLGDPLALIADGGLHERAPHRFAEGGVGHLHATLPARRDLLLAGEELVEAEVLLHERLPERVGIRLDLAEAQVRLDVGQLVVGQHGLEPGEELGHRHVDGLHVVADGGEVGVPIEPGRLLLQPLAVEAVVHLVRIAPVDARHRRPGEHRFDA